MLADVRVCGKRCLGHGIVEHNALLGPQDMIENRLRQQRPAHRRIAQLRGIGAGGHLRRNPLLTVVGQNQQAAFCAGLFDSSAHDHIDQLFQDNFPRHGLGNLEYGGKIKVLDRCCDRSRRTERVLFGTQPRILRLKLSHLAIGAPTQVAVTGVLHIDAGNLAKAACRVETRCQLVGKGFDLIKTAVLRCLDGLLIQRLCIDHPPFDAGDFSADQRSPAGEILRALLCPRAQLPVILRHREHMRPVLVHCNTVAPGCPGQRAIEVIFGFLVKQV
ncbi:hypothetical protein D3C80_1031510 [compost metagenome]